MKTIKSIIAVAIALPLAACGGKGEQSNDENSQTEASVPTEKADSLSIEANATNSEATADANTPVADTETPATEETPAYDADYFSPTGYGPFVLDANISTVDAEKLEPFYNKKSYSKFDHDMDMDIPMHLKGWYTYSMDGKNPIYVTVDNNNKIVRIQISNPKVKNADNIKVGDPVSKLSSDSRFRPASEMHDWWMSDSYYYVHDFDKVTGIFIGELY